MKKTLEDIKSAYLLKTFFFNFLSVALDLNL